MNPNPSQQRVRNGVYCIIMCNGRKWTLAVPQALQPSQAFEFLCNRPEYQQYRGVITKPETSIDLMVYSNGMQVRGPIPVKSASDPQFEPPMDQSLTDPNLDTNPTTVDSYPSPDTLPPVDNVQSQPGSALDMIHFQLGSLRRQISNLESLAMLIGSWQVGSPEELAIRQLLLPSKEPFRS